MPVDQSYIGRTYPPTPAYEVGREKIREFADSIGDADLVYRDRATARAHGYDDVIAPPTFAIVLTLHAGHQVIDDPDFGIDYSRVVHGEQRFVHHRPIRAGDLLQVVVTVENIRVAGGNDIVSTKADVQDTDGASVVTAYSTIVARGSSS
ncbi:MAG: FAS1-like dehydratase domain-containing protein [Jatrophihabitans sp.]